METKNVITMAVGAAGVADSTLGFIIRERGCGTVFGGVDLSPAPATDVAFPAVLMR
jgi:hypothetical protein